MTLERGIKSVQSVQPADSFVELPPDEPALPWAAGDAEAIQEAIKDLKAEKKSEESRGNLHWETTEHETLYLSAALEYFGPFGRQMDKLWRLLNCGVDETWFTTENRRLIFTALFSCSLLVGQPGMTVRKLAIAEEAEKMAGEKGWALKEIESMCCRVGIFSLEEFIEKDIPIWWNKLKRPKTLDIIGKIDKMLTLMPPTIERIHDIDRLTTAALETWRAEPLTKAVEVKIHNDVRNRCLLPIPPDYSIELGLSVFDEMLNGGIGGRNSPDAGRMIVVCARPGAGKSLAAGNIVSRVSARGYKTVFWSLEMGKEELAMRNIAMKDFFYCRMNGRSDYITYERLKYRSYTMDQRLRLEREDYTVIDDNLSIFLGSSNMTPEYIANQMKAYSKINPETRLFVIDHLGLMNIPTQNRAVAVGEATRIIKTTAREMKVDVMLLCQLNRGVEGREDKRPTLSDLRDSGRIEEDSDIVLGLYRPAYYDKTTPNIQNILEVNSLKNRQGKSNYSLECSVYLDSCAIVDPGCDKGLGDEEAGL